MYLALTEGYILVIKPARIPSRKKILDLQLLDAAC